MTGGIFHQLDGTDQMGQNFVFKEKSVLIGALKQGTPVGGNVVRR